MVKICEKCGASYPDGTNFCRTCGVRLIQQQNIYSNPQYAKVRRELILELMKELLSEEKGKRSKFKLSSNKDVESLKMIFNRLPPELKNLLQIIVNIPNHDEAGALIEMLINYGQTGNRKMYIIFMERLSKNLPNNKRVWGELTSMYIDENDLVNALKSCERLVNIDPSDAVEWAKLGGLYSFQAKFDDSINSFKKSLELDPNNYPVIKTLSAVYEFNNDLENAIKFLKQYLTKYPNDKEEKERLDKLMSGKSSLSEVGKRLKDSKDKFGHI